MSDVNESLISLTKNERPWAIRSDCSEEMSDVSESLISLTKNEQWVNRSFFERIAHSLIFGKKRGIRSDIKWANSQPWKNVLQLKRSNHGGGEEYVNTFLIEVLVNLR